MVFMMLSLLLVVEVLAAVTLLEQLDDALFGNLVGYPL